MISQDEVKDSAVVQKCLKALKFRLDALRVAREHIDSIAQQVQHLRRFLTGFWIGTFNISGSQVGLITISED